MSAYKDWTYDSNASYAGLDKIVDDLHSHNQHYVMIIVRHTHCVLNPWAKWLTWSLLSDHRGSAVELEWCR